MTVGLMICTTDASQCNFGGDIAYLLAAAWYVTIEGDKADQFEFLIHNDDHCDAASLAVSRKIQY